MDTTKPPWAPLERLAALHPRLLHYRLRRACGFVPCPHSDTVVAWLKDHADAVAPVIQPDPRTAPVVVFDFSPGSAAWEQADLTQPMPAAAALFQRMQEAGAAVGVGRYNESRFIYTARQYQEASGERRTVHLGIDLFQPAGSPVFVALDGVVHSFRNNAAPLDYGPTIILKHEPDGGPVFYTLYGHLSTASLDGLFPGKTVRSGAQIGTLGNAQENGGWAPHLHLQIIVDMLGMEGDFPGVAAASERAVWLSLSPDPNLLLRIPEDVLSRSMC